MVRKKKLCPICNEEKEIVNEIDVGDHVHQTLSCSHSSRHFNRSLVESVKISDSLSAAKTAKIEPLVSGTIPVEVSGEAIPKTRALWDISGLKIHKENDIYVINQPTIYYQSVHTETTNTTSNMVINNLNDVFIQVENSNRTAEEKEKIKEILKIVDENKSKSIPEVRSALDHLRTWLPIAEPYILMFLAPFFRI